MKKNQPKNKSNADVLPNPREAIRKAEELDELERLKEQAEVNQKKLQSALEEESKHPQKTIDPTPDLEKLARENFDEMCAFLWPSYRSAYFRGFEDSTIIYKKEK